MVSSAGGALLTLLLLLLSSAYAGDAKVIGIDALGGAGAEPCRVTPAGCEPITKHAWLAEGDTLETHAAVVTLRTDAGQLVRLDPVSTCTLTPDGLSCGLARLLYWGYSRMTLGVGTAWAQSRMTRWEAQMLAVEGETAPAMRVRVLHGVVWLYEDPEGPSKTSERRMAVLEGEEATVRGGRITTPVPLTDDAFSDLKADFQTLPHPHLMWLTARVDVEFVDLVPYLAVDGGVMLRIPHGPGISLTGGPRTTSDRWHLQAQPAILLPLDAFSFGVEMPVLIGGACTAGEPTGADAPRVGIQLGGAGSVRFRLPFHVVGSEYALTLVGGGIVGSGLFAGFRAEVAVGL